MKRRSFIMHTAAAACASLALPSAFALMAGAAPDSPTLRLDPNRVDSPFACVASLMGGGAYSAVCITPRFALTAAHVVQHPHDLSLYLNLGADFSHRFTIKRVAFPPPPAQRDPAQPVGDLALVEIDGQFPDGLVMPPFAQAAAQEGLRIELTGYGASGTGDHGVSVGSNPVLKRVGANRIDRVLRDKNTAAALLYYFSFDAVSASRRDAGRSLGNTVETGLASGDSGSPAFVRENGRLALIGINSFVIRSPGTPANGFGTVSGGQVLAAHRAWLLSELGSSAWPGLA
ncbi:MAG: trypsin-like serine protease [Rhizobacter sp.]